MNTFIAWWASHNKYDMKHVLLCFINISASPRSSKDSPASQADSGVFSIASSASPSKVDGVLNSDCRSPDSPPRERISILESSVGHKPEQSQCEYHNVLIHVKDIF